MNRKDCSQALDWGHVLVNKDPDLRPELASLPGLLNGTDSPCHKSPFFLYALGPNNNKSTPSISLDSNKSIHLIPVY